MPVAGTGIKFGATYSHLGDVIGPLEFAEESEGVGVAKKAFDALQEQGFS